MAEHKKDANVPTATHAMGAPVPGYDRVHERRDVNIRAIIWALVGIAITVGIVCLIGYWTFNIFENQAAARDIPPSPVADTNVVPPQPRLQASPAIDMAVFRRYEDSLLSNYGWVDRPAGIARIPIDSAIAVIARRGMDVVRTSGRDTAAAQSLNPEAVPVGESAPDRP